MISVLAVIINENDTLNESSLEIFSFIDSLDIEKKVTAINFGGDKELVSTIPSNDIFYVPIEDSNKTNPQDLILALDKFTTENYFDLIVFQKDDLSNYLAPAFSYRKKIPFLPDVKKFVSSDQDRMKFIRPIHGESAEGLYSVNSKKPFVVKIRKSSFEKKLLSTKKSDIKEFLLQKDMTRRFKILDTKKLEPTGIQLDQADVVISGGRGIGSKEGFKKIKELAKILDGAVGASRAAVEAEWIETSQLVGLTGKWISPNLYFTFGISGASQHLAGCTNSKNIVSVNIDPEASIFNHSRFGIIADCNEFLSELIEELKKTQ